jgi:polyisoprenyl-phosphate glycosyltransferase
VVPIFNEAEAILDFFSTIQRVFDSLEARKEIIFINDGSTDGSFETLLRLSTDCDFVKVVNLSRNFGKEAAMTAGLDIAAGDAIVMIDVDLQDPPQLIETFFARWREGYDIVYGVRQSRSEDGRFRRWVAGRFYATFNRLSETAIPSNAGDFRLLDRRVVDALKLLPERARFFKGLAAWVGFSAVSVAFDRPSRRLGRSKWTYWRLWNFAIDAVTSFSSLPLKVWSYVGGLIAMLAFLYGLFIIARVVVTGRDMPGYASLITVLLFSTGVQMISLGMLGEYVSRVFLEAKQRPIYLLEGVYARGALILSSLVARP